jgi:hypothetical protein
MSLFGSITEDPGTDLLVKQSLSLCDFIKLTAINARYIFGRKLWMLTKGGIYEQRIRDAVREGN